MSIQDEYLSSVRQAQDTWVDIVQSVSGNVRKGLEKSGTSSFGFFDPAGAIEEICDFWIKALELQRDVTKELAGATVAIGQNVQSQAESTTAAIREQGESVNQAVREQTDKTYEALTKAELQAQLASRDLPKAGNVEELRERLIADDKN